jgi:hypothetical protein
LAGFYVDWFFVIMLTSDNLIKNMKTNVTIGIVVAIAIAVGAYFFWNSGSTGNSLTNTVPSENNTEETNNTIPSGKKMAFTELLKQGGIYKCTVTQYVAGTESQGTTYINGDLIRAEYNTKTQGMNIDTSLIVRDGYTYTWTSFAPTMGFKSKVTTGGMEDGSTGTSGTYSFNAEQIGDYDCQAWTADASMFVLPAGVTFREV